MELILNAEQDELLKQARSTLGRLRELLAQTETTAGDRKALADSIHQLDELFLLVVAGEFNSGKSAFINALLGEPLQKEGVTPTTDRIYLLKYGLQSEQTAGENGIWIKSAPAELLRKISIVDTPGTNAIMREHEALTAEFVPRSDLVLFITSADRPFTESERSFLAQIQEWGKKIVLVVNKIDILNGEEEIEQVVEFVTTSAQRLIGGTAAVFAVSARLAQDGDAAGRFAPLENYIQETLDDDGRFRLKLLNPLGVGKRLVTQQLVDVRAHLKVLQEDNSLLDDIKRQMIYYNDDMQRNFKARLGEIDNLLHEMEKRGNGFLDDRIRLARIPDLLRSKQLEADFEKEVVADTPEQIERRVSELVDWLVEQDLRQWTAVSNHLTERSAEHEGRIVGEGGPREGTLAYDRQRLIESIGESTRRAVDSFDKEKEAEELAQSARAAVVNTGLAGIGVGLGVAVVVAAHTAFLDFTGVFAGVAAAALGLLILPARKRKAKQEFAEKLEDLRTRLVDSLTKQFEREMRRSTGRIEDTIAPFTRFIRAEEEKLALQQDQLQELEGQIGGLQQILTDKV
ncbi:MAG: dynamin family protein [Candidatus Promineifilaceae bacterium]|nr:dynamin family protein [Candidatus Promineifilaceae bacterium]